LYDKHHRHVSVMRQFGKQVTYILIGFVHQIVYYQQHPLSSIELIYVGQPLLEFDRWVFCKRGLEFSITVNNLFARGVIMLSARLISLNTNHVLPDHVGPATVR
jgi:hypothetical protein